MKNVKNMKTYDDPKQKKSQIPDTLIETDRLIIRNISLHELDSFLKYRNEPEVARYQSWEPNLDISYGIKFISPLEQTKIGEPGKWNQIIWRLKETNQHIGDCALFVTDEGNQAEIGFTLSQEHQGHGYATEAVSAIMNFVFTEFNIHRIQATCDCKNQGSIKLLERLGMRQEGHFIENIFFKGAWGDEYSYAILKAEWKQQKNT